MMAGAGTIQGQILFKVILTTISSNYYMTMGDLTFCDSSTENHPMLYCVAPPLGMEKVIFVSLYCFEIGDLCQQPGVIHKDGMTVRAEMSGDIRSRRKAKLENQDKKQ